MCVCARARCKDSFCATQTGLEEAGEGREGGREGGRENVRAFFAVLSLGKLNVEAHVSKGEICCKYTTICLLHGTVLVSRHVKQ